MGSSQKRKKEKQQDFKVGAMFHFYDGNLANQMSFCAESETQGWQG